MVQLFKECESEITIGKQAVSRLENIKQPVSQIGMVALLQKYYDEIVWLTQKANG